ncbi:hypothetical protein D9M70_528920 [compost metagenome]
MRRYGRERFGISVIAPGGAAFDEVGDEPLDHRRRRRPLSCQHAEIDRLGPANGDRLQRAEQCAPHQRQHGAVERIGEARILADELDIAAEGAEHVTAFLENS